MKKFIVLIILALSIHCQSSLQRLSNQSPESFFLYIEDSTIATDNWENTLNFISIDHCIKKNLEDQFIFECDSSVENFLNSLSKQGFLKKDSEKVFIQTVSKKELESTKNVEELSQHLASFQDPIEKFAVGSWEIAIDSLTNNKNSQSQDFIIIKKIMEDRIQIRKKKIIAILDSMNDNTDDASVKERSFFLNYNSYFDKDIEFKTSAIKFLNTYSIPELTSCRINIIEPSSRPFVTSGFEEDVHGQIVCDKNLSRPIALDISGNEYLKVGDYSTNEENLNLKNWDKFELSVNSLSMNAEQNVITFTLNTNYKNVINKLKFLSPETLYLLKLVNENYQFQAVPTSFSPAYEELSSRFLNPELTKLGSVENGRIKTEIISNGMFSLGGSNKSGNFDLTFGHPNGVFADGIWSSYTSLKINEDVIKLNDFPTEIIEQSDTKLETLTKIPNHDLEVKIIWESVALRQNSIQISYEVTNLSSQSKEVGIRMLVDTWAGYSDGVPFTLPGNTDYSNRIITNEISFNANTSPNWETTEYNSSGEVFLQNTIVGDTLVAPDEIQLVNWGSAFSNNWDYLVSESRDVTGDSAVVLKWSQKKLESNQSRRVATMFSSIERKNDISFDLTSPNTGNGILIINKKASNCKNLSLDYKVTDGRVLDSKGNSNTEFTFNETDSSEVIQVPLTIYARGKVNLEVKERCSGVTKTHSIPVTLSDDDQFAQPNLFPVSTPIPVQFSSKLSGKKIEARLLDPITDKKIDSVLLKETKNNNIYIYNGSLDPKNNGNYIIEYVDLDATETNTKPLESPKLEKGFAQVNKRKGEIIIGKFVNQDQEYLSIETKDGQLKIPKSEIRSVKYGR